MPGTDSRLSFSKSPIDCTKAGTCHQKVIEQHLPMLTSSGASSSPLRLQTPRPASSRGVTRCRLILFLRHPASIRSFAICVCPPAAAQLSARGRRMNVSDAFAPQDVSHAYYKPYFQKL
eukprot:scaffold3440_cov31-Tisochrysis_lutea.AAC.2